jgi:hypothetical protein
LLALALGIHSTPAIIDVDQQVEPAEDVALRITQRQAKDVVPAVDAVSATVAALDVVRMALLVCLQLSGDCPLEIVRMDDLGGLPAFQLLECLAEVVEGQLIEAFDLA